MLPMTTVLMKMALLTLHDNEGVEIPPSEVQLTEEQFNELQQIVNPLSDCDDMGVDLYLQTLEFVQSVI